MSLWSSDRGGAFSCYSVAMDDTIKNPAGNGGSADSPVIRPGTRDWRERIQSRLSRPREIPRWLDSQPATRAIRIYYHKARAEAIKAMCIDCSSSLVEAKRCEITDCPLWMYRPGHDGALPPGLPSEEEFREIARMTGVPQGNPERLPGRSPQNQPE